MGLLLFLEIVNRVASSLPVEELVECALWEQVLKFPCFMNWHVLMLHMLELDSHFALYCSFMFDKPFVFLFQLPNSDEDAW